MSSRERVTSSLAAVAAELCHLDPQADPEAFHRIWGHLCMWVRAYEALPLDDPMLDSERMPSDPTDTQLFARPKKGRLRWAILELLWSCPADGFSDQDLEQWSQRPHQTVSSARNDLVRTGWLYDSGKRMTNIRNREMILWKMTDRGRQEFERLRGDG